MSLRGIWSVMFVCLVAIATPLHAQEIRPVPDAQCKVSPPAKGKSRQRFDATAFMVVAGELEAQGEKDFRLKYDSPEAECLVEHFTVADATVNAVYSPWEKGPQTLLYRFIMASPDGPREVLVLYSGTAGLVTKGQAFHVTENRAGTVSFYAMFKEEPTYQASKDLATAIFNASAKPLLAVRWPEGGKEGEVVAFDSSKLK